MTAEYGTHKPSPKLRWYWCRCCRSSSAHTQMEGAAWAVVMQCQVLIAALPVPSQKTCSIASGCSWLLQHTSKQPSNWRSSLRPQICSTKLWRWCKNKQAAQSASDTFVRKAPKLQSRDHLSQQVIVISTLHRQPLLHRRGLDRNDTVSNSG